MLVDHVIDQFSFHGVRSVNVKNEVLQAVSGYSKVVGVVCEIVVSQDAASRSREGDAPGIARHVVAANFIGVGIFQSDSIIVI